MHERIKQVRKAKGLTQQALADKIAVSRNNIASYETGKSRPGDAVIALICREFNVNETWLRTGEGEMFVELSRDEEIAAFLGNILNNDDERDFKRRFIAMLSRLDASEWVALERMAKLMAEEKKKD